MLLANMTPHHLKNAIDLILRRGPTAGQEWKLDDLKLEYGDRMFAYGDKTLQILNRMESGVG